MSGNSLYERMAHTLGSWDADPGLVVAIGITFHGKNHSFDIDRFRAAVDAARPVGVVLTPIDEVH